ncbi:hypothetical protein QTO30_20130 [Yoonia sp. GPGPB17]|uniref:hypothetical protein n=1 Tax=Yoonia sp. GPGPB17 TaxID=3026147 RepID=UPI0030BDEEE2
MADKFVQDIIWHGRIVEVSYDPNWLDGMAQHLELRSTRPLPVTQTGYRSRFLQTETVLEEDQIEVFVKAWLDDAADNNDWQKREERDRQGELFDL